MSSTAEPYRWSRPSAGRLGLGPHGIGGRWHRERAGSGPGTGGGQTSAEACGPRAVFGVGRRPASGAAKAVPFGVGDEFVVAMARDEEKVLGMHGESCEELARHEAA